MPVRLCPAKSTCAGVNPLEFAQNVLCPGMGTFIHSKGPCLPVGRIRLSGVPSVDIEHLRDAGNSHSFIHILIVYRDTFSSQDLDGMLTMCWKVLACHSNSLDVSELYSCPQVGVTQDRQVSSWLQNPERLRLRIS